MGKYSAGILIYSYDPNGCVTFLLGRDFRNMYSDFGGRSEPTDISHMDTAAREFYEETCGSVYDIPIVKEKIRKSHIVHSLSYLGNPYYMYMVYVPYSNQQLSRFDDIRRLISNNPNIDNRFKEKLDLQWFTGNEILNKRNCMRQVFYRSFTHNINYINHMTARKVLKH